MKNEKDMRRMLIFVYVKIRIFVLDLFKAKTNVIFNINKDMLEPQKRILLAYHHYAPFTLPVDRPIYHASIIHYFQMIQILQDNNFVIDICDCNNLQALKEIRNVKYDYILGFGEIFPKICDLNTQAKKILFVTENHPDVVKDKYLERLLYYKERNGVKPPYSLKRNKYYSPEMFECADYGIIIGNEFNAQYMYPFFLKSYRIKVNAIFNSSFSFSEKKWTKIRTHFTWFGSNGTIHKGLDILLDYFKLNPDIVLNVFGLSKAEKPIMNRYKNISNIIFNDRVSVQSQSFIDNVVMNNTFVILPSCSEGMASGVATCMAHGLIPIVTRESGLDPQPFILELDDYYLESIDSLIKTVLTYSNEELSRLSRECYDYASKEFSLDNFTSNFANIIDDIINNESVS